MHSLKLRAAMAATLIAIAAASPAAAQFFDTPPVQKKTKKAKQATPKQQPAAPATTAPPAAPSAQPAAIAPPAKPGQRAPYPPPNENCRNTESFPAWLARFKKDAAAAGIRPTTINAVLDGMSIDSKVTSRDRGQKFFSQTFLDFQGKLATPNRVTSGRKKIAQHKATFERAQSEFGVPPSVITGFWALESDFGAGMGNFPIMPALLTLAYDCRRQVMFPEEL
jgi:membrane-bound lytic murein transglycosylase B